MMGKPELESYELDGVPSEALKDNTETNKKNEKVQLLEKGRRVTPQTAIKLRYAAISVSWISTIASLGLGILALVYAAIDDSQSLFSFGLDSILDCISSIIVLWRFHGNSIYSDIKEIRACMMIGVLFILSALFLIIKCVHALVSTELAVHPRIVLILSSMMFGVCLILGGSKIILGYLLESRALITDSVITLVGAVMSLLTLIFSVLYRHNTRLWYLDDTFGLVCSLFLVVYGIRVIWISRKELKQCQITMT
ncbi:hypothetical protein ACF0H5_019242 [Mactra antiquata]